MALLVGIDEAGYGPLLGPLVVGATLWRVAPAAVAADLWEPLSAAVCRASRRGDERLPVGDSKQVFDRKRGLCSLERTVLAFARTVGWPGATIGDLLQWLGAPPPQAAGAFPWYQDLSTPLPLDRARSACAGAAEKLGAVMAESGVVCCGLSAQVITEDAFNARVATTHNKASVLLEAVLRLMVWATERCGDQDLHVLVDRLGGRADYRSLLMGAFPERHVHVLEVGERSSRYRLAAQHNDWHVAFEVDADQRHLPVALASMLAKYVRELLMERFNAFWRRLAPRVRPTAGYYTDAQRFLTEIGPLARRRGLAPERFVRVR